MGKELRTKGVPCDSLRCYQPAAAVKKHGPIHGISDMYLQKSINVVEYKSTRIQNCIYPDLELHISIISTVYVFTVIKNTLQYQSDLFKPYSWEKRVPGSVTLCRRFLVYWVMSVWLSQSPPPTKKEQNTYVFMYIAKK